jgi:putative ABC transport system permease protein
MAGVPLAWRILIEDRKRLALATAGIAFSVLLMVMQLGFRAAFVEGTVSFLRLFDADIVMMNRTKSTIMNLAPFPDQRLRQAAGVPGVASARPLYMEEDRAVLKDSVLGPGQPVQVVAFDPDRPVLLSHEVEAARTRLRQPNTALIDTRWRGFLGSRPVAPAGELTRRNIRIVGSFAHGPTFLSQGRLIMSDWNFLRYFADDDKPPARLSSVEYGLLKLAPGAQTAHVIDDLERALPDDVRILTKDAAIAEEERYQADQTSVGPVFGVGIAIGFLVGLLVTYQIMFAHLSAQRPQYATLKAIGYRNRYLVRVVLEQAAILALCGFVAALAVSALLYRIVERVAQLPMALSPETIGVTLALTLGMCILAGALAVRRVLDADPAELF